MDQARLIILVGMIASGKSSICAQKAQEGALIINDDAIVSAVHGGNYRLYNKALKPLYKTIEQTLLATGLAMGRTVIVDRPCFKRMTRLRYVSLAKSFDAPITCYTFVKEHESIHAERRYHSDPRGYGMDYWMEVATRHSAQWEEPALEEGYDELVKVNYSPTDGLLVLSHQLKGLDT